MADSVFSLVSSLAYPLVIGIISFWAGMKYRESRNEITGEKPKQTLNSPTDDDNEVTNNEYESFKSGGAYKMMLVVRNDLKMGKGKIGAQCGHASVGVYQIQKRNNPKAVNIWENNGCPKIAVKVQSEKELLDVRNAAKRAGIAHCLIRDAGRTQIAPSTMTVLGLGPAPAELLDSITGHLGLL